jgi:hypothetical protein
VNKPIINWNTVSEKGDIRNLYLFCGIDEKFYIVMTDMRWEQGWDSNGGIVLF